jgi:hypothetical protein
MNLHDSLPAPLQVINGLHILTLTLHFIAMNFLVGGVVLVLAGVSGRNRGNATVRRLMKLLPTGMAATVTMGVAPLLFLQLVYSNQIYPAAIVSAWFWLLIIPSAIAAYYLFYGAAFAGQGRARTGWFYVMAGSVCLALISLVYSSVFSLAERPGLVRSLYLDRQDGIVWNPGWTDYAFRWLHMISGAITVGGYIASIFGKNDPEFFPAARRMFVFGMLGSYVAGVAYLVQVARSYPVFMRSPAIWAVALGALLSAGALHLFYKKRFVLSGTAIFISLTLMVFARHNFRLLKLLPHFDPYLLPVVPQWIPFSLFLASFVLALVVTIFMLRLFFAGPRNQRDALKREPLQ